jgi:hypothetical protein
MMKRHAKDVNTVTSIVKAESNVLRDLKNKIALMGA